MALVPEDGLSKKSNWASCKETRLLAMVSSAVVVLNMPSFSDVTELPYHQCYSLNVYFCWV